MVQAPFFTSDTIGRVTCCETLDLQIMDQDEGWKSGVTNTWRAENMVPGDSFEFSGSFVGLRADSKGLISVGCDYSVIEENPPSPADTDPATDLHPDALAKYLVITTCVYLGGDWQIDCLTGALTVSKKNPPLERIDRSGWILQDADGDGRITFCDLKMQNLSGLPLGANFGDARFEMSVDFSTLAGNDLQGDSLVLAMGYTLTSG
jgi:hypothetical protein